ncbi:MAG TPA: amidophosphoribosyltransferase [Limnochordia bacterium]|nr:amidophosphoribosyltransferase [Limnochordia bacterium]
MHGEPPFLQAPGEAVSAWADDDHPHDECGVFGIYSPTPVDAATLTYLGLYALQHRGQESAGIAVSDGRDIRLHKGMGLVTQVFDEGSLAALPGSMAMGHVRYSTTGASLVANAQPLMVYSAHGQLAIAHNGNLTNTKALKAELQRDGSVFQSTTDSELIVNLIARHPANFADAVAAAVERLKGAYSIVGMTTNQLVGWRDPMGIRPLCIGRQGDAWALASESCAFATIGFEKVRDLAPGEMAVIDATGVRFRQIRAPKRKAFCVFEFIYFARPDSEFDGKNVHLVRKQIGRELAKASPADADLVIAAPDSGTSAAMGYAEAAGLPFEIGLVKNRYVGRTFIQPRAEMRHLSVRIKLTPIKAVLAGKRIVLIDDSIVRGTTSAKMIEMLRDAGVKEVHMRVASPAFNHPCHYGIDVPDRAQLLASHRTLDEICRFIGADSLEYLSFESLYAALGMERAGFCDACFSGDYPEPIPVEEPAQAR